MIQIEKLNKIYDRHGRNANHVLRDVSLALPETGFVCILGESGCGKTSLLNAIGGLDSFDGGTVTASGVTTSGRPGGAFELERNRSFGYIFQNYYLLSDHSAAYNVYLGLHSLKLSHEEKLKRVEEALRAVGMERYSRRTVGELSGGQQQRIAIARALARKPRVIFADEPTGNLDEANTVHICSLLRRISKTSLVVMVTHEEHIARFFADRIITIDRGQLRSDETHWERKPLTSGGGKQLYTGDYQETIHEEQGLRLRLLREPSAQPVELTLLVTGEQIVLKLSDGRSAVLGSPEQAPVLAEGKRPVLTLESLEGSPELTQTPERQPEGGGKLGFGMLLREALRLSGGGGLRRAGMGLFLVLLTLLSMLTVGDYLTLASLNPEDFITSDSHVLEVRVEQGSVMYGDGRDFKPVLRPYIAHVRQLEGGHILLPHVSNTPEYGVELFRQMETVSMKFLNFSYVPLQMLPGDTLLYGRMPQRSEEIVVDRWILEKAIASEGILQNSISDIRYFLGAKITFTKRDYAPTIVGICDSGQPAMYLDLAGLLSIGVGGIEVTPLSDLQQVCPGVFDDVTLDKGECIVVTNNAGMSYHNKIGQTYTSSTRHSFTIVDAVQAQVSGKVVIADQYLEDLLWSIVADRFYLYCPDKAVTRAALSRRDSQPEQDGYAIVTVTDRYQNTYNAYKAASTRKADARSIVTFTVMGLCLVMLYLLCRAQVRKRLEMLSVYRLLGIPGRSLGLIFSLESLLVSLRTVLPAGILCWCGVQLAGGLILPWQAAALVCGVIAAAYLLLSLLPMGRLLRLPPARLAAKFDI